MKRRSFLKLPAGILAVAIPASLATPGLGKDWAEYAVGLYSDNEVLTPDESATIYHSFRNAVVAKDYSEIRSVRAWKSWLPDRKRWLHTSTALMR